MDDITLSSSDLPLLNDLYLDLLRITNQAGLSVNHKKCVEPTENLVAFNCSLTSGESVVTLERVRAHYLQQKGPLSDAAFEQYRASVSKGNIPKP